MEGQGVLLCPGLEVHAAWLSKKLPFLSFSLQEETGTVRKARPQCPCSRLTHTACLGLEAEARPCGPGGRRLSVHALTQGGEHALRSESQGRE